MQTNNKHMEILQAYILQTNKRKSYTSSTYLNTKLQCKK